MNLPQTIPLGHLVDLSVRFAHSIDYVYRKCKISQI